MALRRNFPPKDFPMKKAILIGVVLLVLLASVVHAYNKELSAVDTNNARNLVKIYEGSSTAQIADVLVSKNLIRSAFAFKVYIKLHGLTGSLKAGSFILESSMDTPAIIAVLTGGKTVQEVVTIPEGYTVEDIDALLTKKGIIQAGDFTHCAQACDFSSFTFLPKNTAALAPRGGKVEGYLFPDTYYVEVDNFVPKFFIERLLSTFKARVIDPHAADIASSKRSVQQIVAMASLIESETRSPAERPIVAGILWKRFDMHMSLGVDASVRYVLDRGNSPLTASDLQIDSPYNLRKKVGLPPGPIASPSLSSIDASLHPEPSPYFYYLHDASGTIHYAVTNDQQNANRAKYLQ
jgi:UPF0755 protein